MRKSNNVVRIYHKFARKISNSGESAQNGPLILVFHAWFADNFELKSTMARPALPSILPRAFQCVAARRTRPASRYARSNTKFISRFRSESRWESWKVTRRISDTSSMYRVSPIDLTDPFRPCKLTDIYMNYCYAFIIIIIRVHHYLLSFNPSTTVGG